MYFTVLAHGVSAPAHSELRAFLLTDNWDDWFKYNTMYTLIVYPDPMAADCQRYASPDASICEARASA